MHMELMSATEVSITYTAVKSTKGTEVSLVGTLLSDHLYRLKIELDPRLIPGDSS